jgi:16S rRNA (guanine(966)-N(2))-methyltransferase RsmD
MRIIAGECRGTQLEVAKGKITRPIPDSVRQALFSSLGSEYGTPGQMPEINVVDMFAGSGSFGLECLSRGAKLCCFFEKNYLALRHLRQNISKCKMEGRAWIVSGSAYDCELPASPDPKGWDLVYLDPPYINVELNLNQNSVPNLLIALSDSGLLAPDAWVILRHPVPTDYQRCMGKLRPVRDKKYGTMRFTWFRFDQELT